MSLPTESEPIVATEACAGDVVLSVENVSIVYKVTKERITSLKEYAIRRAKRQLVIEEFWALKNVSFELRSGEVFGIMGSNGAGKSTMLKVIARVLRPTAGRVRVCGHVAPLLEMGAGFHMELTGRENIYLYGSLLGYSRTEMDEKFDRIVSFADIGEFIDSPLRTYSTGMVTRLGFSIATDVKPEILIVDEILGVGDAAFQQKSRARMLGFCAEGTTVILVSHNADLMRTTCQRAMWLDHGQVKMIGPIEEVADAYAAATMVV
ncbi:MAG: ABC transporter ATP-binding protein [Coriobacteriia bacterium]|nr:ABC transporter ATP-binding protein [Coriobacteriia bacterium]